MRKNITHFLSLLLLVAGLCVSNKVQAVTEYGFYVGETKVTSDNYKNILGDGYFSYDPSSKTLTVKSNAKLNNSGGLGSGISNRSVDGLIVKFLGNATFNTRSRCISSEYGNTTELILSTGYKVSMTSSETAALWTSGKISIATVGGGGELVLNASTGISGYNNAGEFEILTNCKPTITINATESAMQGLSGITLRDCVIALPSEGTYDTSKKYLVDVFGDKVTTDKVLIVPKTAYTAYGLKVGGVRVNNYNTGGIQGKTISGSVTYNASKNMLTLAANAVVDMSSGVLATNAISNMGVKDLVISAGKGTKLVGYNTLSAVYVTENTSIATGTATMADVTDLTIEKGIKVRYSSQLTFNNAKVKVDKIVGESSETTNKVSFQGPHTIIRTNEITNLGVTYDSGNDVKMALPLGASYISSKGYVVMDDGTKVTSGILIAKTTTYPIYFGENKINNWAAPDLLGDGSKAIRYVSASSTAGTLYLNNANFANGGSLGSAISCRGVKDFVVNVSGNNTLTGRNAALSMYMEDGSASTLKIEGDGTLNLVSTDSRAFTLSAKTTATVSNITLNINSASEGIYCGDNTQLTFDNAKATITPGSSSYPIWSLTKLNFVNCDIVSPAGDFYLKNGRLAYLASGEYLAAGTPVTIGPLTKYGITIAGIPVTNYNEGDVLGDGGTVKYDPAYNRIDLNNANFGNGIYISDTAPANVRINVEGTNFVRGNGTAAALDINDNYVSMFGHGALYLSEANLCGIRLYKRGLEITGSHIGEEGPSVYISQNGTSSDGIKGMTGEEKLSVEKSTLEINCEGRAIRDIKTLSLIYDYITQPAGAYFDESQKTICSGSSPVENTTVRIEDVEDYAIEVADNRVHNKNCNDIQGPGISGTVRYDRETNTLFLANATIEGENWGIMGRDYAEGKDFIIHVEGNNSVKGKKYNGLSSSLTWSGNTTKITGSGSLVFTSEDEDAIYYNHGLTISGCDVSFTSIYKSGINANGGYLTVDKAHVKAAGATAAIQGVSALNLIDTKICDPDGGLFDAALGGITAPDSHSLVYNAEIRLMTEEELGVEGITADGTVARSVYNAQGQRTDRMQKGVNIIRKADGTTYKMIKR